mgnify:CR=1 FL=1
MGWLFGPTLFSVIVALIVVRIFDYIKDGIFNGPTGDVSLVFVPEFMRFENNCIPVYK